MDKLSHRAKAVAEAKQLLIASAGRIDYLAPVKQHPIQSMLIAFSAGLIINKKDNNSFLPPSLLSLLLSAIRKL